MVGNAKNAEGFINKTRAKVIDDIRVYIPCKPFLDMPFEDIPLEHTQEGDIIKFEIPYELTWLTEAFGIKIQYTQGLKEE